MDRPSGLADHSATGANAHVKCYSCSRVSSVATGASEHARCPLCESDFVEFVDVG